MSKDPAVLFYTADFLVGCMTMTDAQVGRYIRLLCLQHQIGHLTEKQMLSVCGDRDESVFGHFVTDVDGLFYNPRMDEEANKRRRYSASRSKNRKESCAHKDNICSSYDVHMENESENENVSENEGVSVSESANTRGIGSGQACGGEAGRAESAGETCVDVPKCGGAGKPVPGGAGGEVESGDGESTGGKLNRDKSTSEAAAGGGSGTASGGKCGKPGSGSAGETAPGGAGGKIESGKAVGNSAPGASRVGGGAGGGDTSTDVFREFAGGDRSLLSALRDFEKMRVSMKKPMTDRARRMLVNRLKSEFLPGQWVPVLEQSISRCWADVYPLKRGSPGVGKMRDDRSGGYAMPGADELQSMRRFLEEIKKL